MGGGVTQTHKLSTKTGKGWPGAGKGRTGTSQEGKDRDIPVGSAQPRGFGRNIPSRCALPDVPCRWAGLPCASKGKDGAGREGRKVPAGASRVPGLAELQQSHGCCQRMPMPQTDPAWCPRGPFCQQNLDEMWCRADVSSPSLLLLLPRDQDSVP